MFCRGPSIRQSVVGNIKKPFVGNSLEIRGGVCGKLFCHTFLPQKTFVENSLGIRWGFVRNSLEIRWGLVGFSLGTTYLHLPKPFVGASFFIQSSDVVFPTMS